MKAILRKPAPAHELPHVEYTVELREGGFAATFADVGHVHNVVEPRDVLEVADADGNPLSGVVQSVSRRIDDGSVKVVVDAKFAA
jgi:hypothetical protein